MFPLHTFGGTLKKGVFKSPESFREHTHWVFCCLAA